MLSQVEIKDGKPSYVWLVEVPTPPLRLVDDRIPPFDKSLKIEILYNLHGLVIVNKPWDMRIDGNPFLYTVQNILQNNIFHEYMIFPAILDNIHGVDSLENRSVHLLDRKLRGTNTLEKCDTGKGESFHLVNQLDYGTSGILVLASSPRTARTASLLFRKRLTTKVYITVLVGHATNKKTNESCKDIYGIPYSDTEFPRDHLVLGRPCFVSKKIETSSSGKEMYVSNTGKECQSVFLGLRNTMVSGMKVCIALVSIITGRRHQIRVHALSLGHPVLGDKTYSAYWMESSCCNIRNRLRGGLLFDSNDDLFFDGYYNYPRMMLHAWRLRLRFNEIRVQNRTFVKLEKSLLDSVIEVRSDPSSLLDFLDLSVTERASLMEDLENGYIQIINKKCF